MKLTFMLAVVAASLALAACGGNSNGSRGAQMAKRVDIVYGDCSSFRRYTRAFVPDMLTIAQDSALHRHRLLAGCFDGAPLRTMQFKTDIDFGDLPKELRNNATLARRFNVARALGLKKTFEVMADTPTRVRGSGQLEALELASELQGVGRVWMFTDGIVNEVDGLHLTTATEKDIQRTIRRWVPRMGNGLRNVHLAFVGVGLGTGSTANVRKARRLLRGIVDGAGGSFTWSQTLANVNLG